MSRNITEYALSVFRGSCQGVTIDFGTNGGIRIRKGEIEYNGDAMSNEEALIGAVIHFEAKTSKALEAKPKHGELCWEDFERPPRLFK